VQKGRDDAVIVVDMLRGFHNLGNLKNPRTGKVILPIKNLLERKTRKEGCFTVFLQDWHKKNDPEFNIFPEHCVRAGERKIIDKLREFSLLPNSQVVPKSTYSGFYGTRLGLRLQIKNPARVIVVGVCSDICVLHTVTDLRKRNYPVIVPADCVETFDAPGHEAEAQNTWALSHMENILGATVVQNANEIT